MVVTGLPHVKICSGLLGMARFQMSARPSDRSSPTRGVNESEGVSSGDTTFTAADPLDWERLDADEGIW